MKSYTLLYPKNWKDLKYQNPKIIKVEEGKNLNFSSHLEIKKKIEKEWRKVKRSNKKLFNESLYRLSGFKERGGKLVLNLGRTNFKELIGTNQLFFSDKNFFNYLIKLGKKEENFLKYFSNGLAVGAIIQTKDDYILISRRSKEMPFYPDTFHTIAGHPNSGSDRNSEESIVREIKEEADLDKNEYKIYFLGLVRNNQTFKPELIYLAQAKQGLAEILTRRGKDISEFKSLFGLKKEDLKKFLKSFPQKEFCPPGLAAWQIYLQIEENKNDKSKRMFNLVNA